MEKTLKSACEEIKTESESKQNKFKEFLKTSGGLVFAPLIVFVLYFIQLIFNGVYPFGNGDYTVVSYDLSAQICPFIEHLFDVLDGESSLFYTYKLAGGTDVFGTFAYFFISPFSFIFLLFGDGNVYNAAGIVMALKLAFVAFSGTLFVKKLFKNIPTLIGGAVGVTYAFCGYTFVSNTYINWTDFLIWLPLCVLAFVRFDKTGKFWAFSTTMALCVYTCFSIACFAMLTVFPVLVSYVFICKKKEERTPFIAYLSLSFAFALILALPVLLPSLASFLGAGRGGTLFENFWFGKTDSGFSNKEFYDVSSTAWYRKFSYILSDGLFVALTVLYFVKSGLKTPISKFMLTAGLFTMLPVVVDESMILLNMGSYMSYALRFGFLNALYFTAGGCLALDGLFAESKEQKGKLNEIENEKEKAELLNGTKNKNKSVWIYFSVCLAVAILLSVFLATDLYVTVWEYVFKDSAMVSDTKNFSSMFAHSLGGLQTVAVIFVSMAIVTLTGWLFVKHKKIGVWTVSLLLFAVNLVPTVFYSEQIVVGNLSTHYNMDHYKTMVKVLNEKEEGKYFRVKDYEDKLTANAPLTGDAAAYSGFSSLIAKENFALAELFGFWGNGKNNIKSTGGNKFGDAFMGYKYFYVTVDKAEKVEELPYIKTVSYQTENGEYKETLQAGSFFMYENQSVFPLAYTVNSGELNLPKALKPAYRNENQRALYDYLNGEPYQSESKTVTATMVDTLSVKLWQRAAKIDVQAGKIQASVTAKEGEYLLLNFVASKGYTATVNGKRVELCQNDLNLLCVPLEKGENEVVLSYSSPYPKMAFVGVLGAVVLCVGGAFLMKKTKIVKGTEKILAWLGVGLAIGVTGFFFVFPTAVFIGKLGLSIRTAWF